MATSVTHFFCPPLHNYTDNLTFKLSFAVRHQRVWLFILWTLGDLKVCLLPPPHDLPTAGNTALNSGGLNYNHVLARSARVNSTVWSEIWALFLFPFSICFKDFVLLTFWNQQEQVITKYGIKPYVSKMQFLLLTSTLLFKIWVLLLNSPSILGRNCVCDVL